MARLEGMVCVVTGAGSRSEGIGNGRATSILFAREGARVLVCDKDPEAAQVTVDMISEEGGVAAAYVGDLTLLSAAEAMVEMALSRWGAIDVLHNNIGINGPGTVVDATEDLWDRVMTVNVKTMMLASKAAIPVLAKSDKAAIVNISSISALRPRGLTTYSASKGAVIALSRAMAVDHAGEGIRVNCIAPGPVYTPHVTSDGMSAELRERRRLASPLKIEGTAWDVANASLFLASSESRYITGVLLPVDGGVILSSAAR